MLADNSELMFDCIRSAHRLYQKRTLIFEEALFRTAFQCELSAQSLRNYYEAFNSKWSSNAGGTS